MSYIVSIHKFQVINGKTAEDWCDLIIGSYGYDWKVIHIDINEHWEDQYVFSRLQDAMWFWLVWYNDDF